jgi:hypothetical protein
MVYKEIGGPVGPGKVGLEPDFLYLGFELELAKTENCAPRVSLVYGSGFCVLLTTSARQYLRALSRQSRTRVAALILKCPEGTGGSTTVQSLLCVPAFFEASFTSFPLRRDPAQPTLFQVGTPSFGRSHCVKNRYPISNAINHTHSGMFHSLLAINA